jgi:tripartite-type tricarboxylate transporter receptor subunit TctC
MLDRKLSTKRGANARWTVSGGVTMIGRRRLLQFMAASAAAVASRRAAAESYPSRPVRIIVPFGAGGPPDVIARLAAQKLSEKFGQQFYVEDLPGAGGNTGTAAAARATPDGYTLLIMSTGFLVNPSLYDKVPYDPVKDFAPISLLASSPNVVMVHPSFPATTLKELIDIVKTHPGTYSYAQPSTGSTPHLSGELLKLRFGLDLTAVPFNSAPQAVMSAIGGHTPIAITALPPAIASIRDGKVRAIAITSATRAPALPDVPTMAEAGASGEEAATLNGILAPAGTPREIIDQLYREFVQVMADADVKQRMETLGFTPMATTPAQFAERIKFEMEKWGAVIREAKIRAE